MPMYHSEPNRSAPNEIGGNGPTIKPDFQPTKHRDGTVSYWSVYQQLWVRTMSSLVPDTELAAMGDGRRHKIGL